MNIQEQIKLETDHLLNGQSTRIICPRCKSDERSMVVSCDNNLLRYKCFRATCNNSSGIVGGVRRQTSNRTKQFVPKVLAEPTIGLTKDVAEWLKDSYELENLHKQGVVYLPLSHRIYMPVYNWIGGTIGGVAKYILKGIKPKTVLYRHQDVPMVHFPKDTVQHPEDAPLVICEDILSSIKVQYIAPACAILGTHLTDGMAEVLYNTGRDIIFMLDPDAVDKAVHMSKRYRALFKSKVVVPSADPKDTLFVDLGELIYGT